MDVTLFEDLVAEADQTRVKHGQVWLIFFDAPTCKRCPEVYDVFLDLSNVPELVSVFKLAHVVCPRSMDVCNRLGIRGYPTISVLDGNSIYDYQGKLSVDGLAAFIKSKTYLVKSKARRISHVTSPYENIVNALTIANLKVRAFTMLLFKVVGLGHLEEDFVIQVVYMCALTPFLLLFIALYVDNKAIKEKQEQEKKNASM